MWKELKTSSASTRVSSAFISSLSLAIEQAQAAGWKATVSEWLTGARLYLAVDYLGYVLDCDSGDI